MGGDGGQKMGSDGEMLAVRSPPAKRKIEKCWVRAMIQRVRV